jgi:hypothetical protein
MQCNVESLGKLTSAKEKLLVLHAGLYQSERGTFSASFNATSHASHVGPTNAWIKDSDERKVMKPYIPPP